MRTLLALGAAVGCASCAALLSLDDFADVEGDATTGGSGSTAAMGSGASTATSGGAGMASGSGAGSAVGGMGGEGGEGGEGGSEPTCSKRVFVTHLAFLPSFADCSGTPPGNPDSCCNNIALGAGLTGAWFAFTSGTSGTAMSKVMDAGAQSWCLLKPGSTLADEDRQIATSNDLLGGALAFPIDRNEAGMAPDGSSSGVWTGSNFNGTPALNCMDWTVAGGVMGKYGLFQYSDLNWVFAGDLSCNGNFYGHLYCFEM